MEYCYIMDMLEFRYAYLYNTISLNAKHQCNTKTNKVTPSNVIDV